MLSFGANSELNLFPVLWQHFGALGTFSEAFLLLDRALQGLQLTICPMLKCSRRRRCKRGDPSVNASRRNSVCLLCFFTRCFGFVFCVYFARIRDLAVAACSRLWDRNWPCCGDLGFGIGHKFARIGPCVQLGAQALRMLRPNGKLHAVIPHGTPAETQLLAQ